MGSQRENRIHAQPELELRHRLGIPDDAERVLIFGESSHWDPDWLYSSEVYYRRFVEKVIDQAIDCLIEQPRRIYTIESVFFLRMYWERRPERQHRIRQLMQQRRLRLANPAVSTADTLIPSAEAILRDFLIGQEWLRSNGLETEHQLAYFPDSFGASPALPSLLQAAGFSQTALTRIDGMYFPGFELNLPGRYPRPGSSAHLLMKEERTLDFVWRDRSGAEVLCHWNAFSYFQGDLLGHRGLTRIYFMPLAVSDRSERNVARRIRRYVRQLGPLSPTPYMFCPIGVDFITPIPDIVSLLDRYNQRRYQRSGVWAVNAGLDDYLELVGFHRHALPTVELDPNPYWAGFYSARPALKERCHDLVDRLLLAERLGRRDNGDGAGQAPGEELDAAWWTAAVANHHDFITGTSPDLTVEGEQIPWLETASAAVDQALKQLCLGHQPQQPPGLSLTASAPRWSRHGSRLRVETSHYCIELDAALGGAIVCAEDPQTGAPLLQTPSNDLVSYRGSGGLWRMGHEIEGGLWRSRRRASDRPAEFETEQVGSALIVSWTSELDGEPIQRSARFDSGSPLIRFQLSGRAARRRTITVQFATGLEPDRLVMDVPGGLVQRPRIKSRTPTFWPLQHFVHLRAAGGVRGLAAFQRRPGAAAISPDGALELVALRNATRERAFRWFPVSGHPAGGYEPDRYSFDYALLFTGGGDWAANALPATAHALSQDGWGPQVPAAVRARAAQMPSVDRADVWVLADKPASRGDGRVVRLCTHAAHGQPVRLNAAPNAVSAAYLCDSRERDLQPLQVQGGVVELEMPGSIASVRLIP